MIQYWVFCPDCVRCLFLLKRSILMTCVCIRYVEITLIVSIDTCKEVTQLVSTSNKRSSSGEVKIDLKKVGLYRGEMGLTLWKIKDELWSLIFTPCMEVVWSMISVMYGCEVTVAIKLDVWRHILTPIGVFGDEGMALLNSCQRCERAGLLFNLKLEFWQTTQLNSVGFWPYRLLLSIWVYVGLN